MRETSPFNHISAQFVTKNCHTKRYWRTIFHQYMKKKNRTNAIRVNISFHISSIWKGILTWFMRKRSHSSAQLVINASPKHICWIGILKQCMRGNSFSALCVLKLSLVKINSRSTWMKDTKIPLRIRNYQILKKTTKNFTLIVNKESIFELTL